MEGEPEVLKASGAIGKLKWDPDHPDRPEDKNIGNCNDWWDAEKLYNFGFLLNVLTWIDRECGLWKILWKHI